MQGMLTVKQSTYSEIGYFFAWFLQYLAFLLHSERNQSRPLLKTLTLKQEGAASPCTKLPGEIVSLGYLLWDATLLLRAFSREIITSIGHSMFRIHHSFSHFLFSFISEIVMESVDCWVAKRGTGEVASMRAGFRIIGRDKGGTPTCKGEASGWRIRGCCATAGGISVASFIFPGAAGEAKCDPKWLEMQVFSDSAEKR